MLPSGETHVPLWISRCGKQVLPTTNPWCVANVQVLTPLSLLESCRLWFPTMPGNVCASLPIFAFQSPNTARKSCRGVLSMTSSSFPYHMSLSSSAETSVGAWITINVTPIRLFLIFFSPKMYIYDCKTISFGPNRCCSIIMQPWKTGI